MALSKAEKQRLKKEKLKNQKEQKKSAEKKKKLYRNIGIVSVLIILVAVSLIYAYNQSQRPAYYDDFAKCLADKGVIVYGTNSCQYTKAQLDMFGRADEHLDYRHYMKTSGITTTPTWEYEGERYPNVQTLDFLSELSGCPLPEQ